MPSILRYKGHKQKKRPSSYSIDNDILLLCKLRARGVIQRLSGQDEGGGGSKNANYCQRLGRKCPRGGR